MLATPDGISIISTLDGQCLRVSWGPVTLATSYKLYRSAIPYANFDLLVSTPNLTNFYTPDVREPNNNIRNLHWFKVQAISSSDESIVSRPYSFYPYRAFDSSPTLGLSFSTLLGESYPNAF